MRLVWHYRNSNDDKHFSPAADWAKEDSARVWDRGVNLISPSLPPQPASSIARHIPLIILADMAVS